MSRTAPLPAFAAPADRPSADFCGINSRASKDNSSNNSKLSNPRALPRGSNLELRLLQDNAVRAGEARDVANVAAVPLEPLVDSRPLLGQAQPQVTAKPLLKKMTPMSSSLVWSAREEAD